MRPGPSPAGRPTPAARVRPESSSRARLPDSPFLYPLCDVAAGGAAVRDLAAAAVDGGARIVQVRDKGATDRTLLDEIRAVVQACRASGALAIVNDRVDLALLGGAAGVHVGDEDLAVEDVRRVGGPDLLIGLSTHDVEEAVRAADKALDYVAIGPIYASLTKPGRPPLGPEAIRQIRARIALPLVAIGGISADRVAEVFDAGADGVAVVAAVMVPGQVRERTAALVAQLDRLRAGRRP